MLPPSTLFKNRLFIERDNKNKRVMSNLGASFRSSKWSNYSIFNTKFSLKKNYFNFTFICAIFFLIFAVLHENKEYYVVSAIYNALYWSFWAGIDGTDYYASYALWTVGGFVASAFKNLYSFFFFNNLSKNAQNSKKTQTAAFTFKKNRIKDFVEKTDVSWIFYSFLKKSEACLGAWVDKRIVDDLFDTSFNLKKWCDSFDLYVGLFKSTRVFILGSTIKNFYCTNPYMQRLHHFLFLGDPYILQKQWAAHAVNSFGYYHKCAQVLWQNRQNLTQDFFKNKLKEGWNAKRIEIQNLKNNFLIKTKIGFFANSRVNHGLISNFLIQSKELKNITQQTKEQLKITKINRWLYRYSVLGRKILKNSHKITMSKKVLNFNFYEKNDFTKNIWTSANVEDLLNSDNKFASLLSNTNRFTPTLRIAERLNNATSLFVNGAPSSLFIGSRLPFYEKSYFWFLKRAYLFNGVGSNQIFSERSSVTNERAFDSKTVAQNGSLIQAYLLKNTNQLNLLLKKKQPTPSNDEALLTKPAQRSPLHLDYNELDEVAHSVDSALSYAFNQRANLNNPFFLTIGAHHEFSTKINTFDCSYVDFKKLNSPEMLRTLHNLNLFFQFDLNTSLFFK